MYFLDPRPRKSGRPDIQTGRTSPLTNSRVAATQHCRYTLACQVTVCYPRGTLAKLLVLLLKDLFVSRFHRGQNFMYAVVFWGCMFISSRAVSTFHKQPPQSGPYITLATRIQHIYLQKEVQYISLQLLLHELKEIRLKHSLQRLVQVLPPLFFFFLM